MYLEFQVVYTTRWLIWQVYGVHGPGPRFFLPMSVGSAQCIEACMGAKGQADRWINNEGTRTRLSWYESSLHSQMSSHHNNDSNNNNSSNNNMMLSFILTLVIIFSTHFAASHTGLRQSNPDFLPNGNGTFRGYGYVVRVINHTASCFEEPANSCILNPFLLMGVTSHEVEGNIFPTWESFGLFLISFWIAASPFSQHL